MFKIFTKNLKNKSDKQIYYITAAEVTSDKIIY